MTSSDETLSQVRTVLQQFQDGYTKRDTEALDEFMELFVPEEELEVIGTDAAVPGEGEWCLGREAARKLFENDWKCLDVIFDVENTHIHVLGDVAWLATPGTISRSFEEEEVYRLLLDYVRKTLEGDMIAETKAFEIVRRGSEAISEIHQGERFMWPFRFTAVLVQREQGWRFHQIQFSFPSVHFPDVRVSELES